MERNQLLKISSTACTVLSALQIAGIAIATIMLIHWHLDKQFYRGFTVSDKGVSIKIVTTETVTRDGNGKVLKTVKSENNEPANDKVSLAEILPFSFYFSYLKGVVSMLMLFYIFREFGKIISSVKALQAFRTENIASFRKIGKYLLIIFLVSGFHFIGTKTVGTSSANVGFDFDGLPLILMLVAYVLAEIFKEGNRLYEEEQLTV